MISQDETKHIASLARIGATEKEREKFSADLSAVLDWIGQLEKIDLENVPPTARVTGALNVSREDKISDFEEKASIVKLFPEEKNGYAKVRSVM